jgi:hypothetical protein
MSDEKNSMPDTGHKDQLTRSILIPLSGLATQLRKRISANGKIRTKDITASLGRRIAVLGFVGAAAGAALHFRIDQPLLKLMGIAQHTDVQPPMTQEEVRLAPMSSPAAVTTMTKTSVELKNSSSQLTDVSPVKPTQIKAKKAKSKDKVSKSKQVKKSKTANAKQQKESKKKRTSAGIAQVGR